MLDLNQKTRPRFSIERFFMDGQLTTQMILILRKIEAKKKEKREERAKGI